jgi:hypothetical protein
MNYLKKKQRGTIPKITSNPRKKARLQDSIDREILDALNKPPDEDEAFFISITPAVRKMSDEDIRHPQSTAIIYTPNNSPSKIIQDIICHLDLQPPIFKIFV